MLDENGAIAAVAEEPIATSMTTDGGVELDPTAVLRSIVVAGQRVLAESGLRVAAVGIANQGEAVIAWDRRSGAATSSIISWQDRRSASLVEHMAEHSDELRQRTGLPLDPYFTAPKIAWLRQRTASSSVVTGIDAWIHRQLIGEAVTDVATASRSLLLDLTTRTWSERNAELFGLDPADFPRLVSSAEYVGTTSVFGPELPVTGLIVDQQAALLGEHCLSPGQAKCTYGTGAFFLVNTGTTPVHSSAGLSSSVAWTTKAGAAYCLDGQVYAAGSAVRWLEEIGLLSGASDIDALVASASDSARCVPAFAGLGAPHWSPRSKATIEGLSLATTRADIVRAVIESIAAQVAGIARGAAQDMGAALQELKVDGGLTQSAALMQLQADLAQVPVSVYGSAHATAIGVATLARVGAGFDPELQPPVLTGGARFEPRMSPEAAAERLTTWEDAVHRVVENAEAS